MKKIIYWLTKDRYNINAIKQKFHINGITVNGESIVDVAPEDEDIFQECIKRKLFVVRNKTIKKNNTK